MDFRKYCSIPFKDLGRTIEGIDCWGLIVLFYRQELQIELPETLGYTTCSNANEVSKDVEAGRPSWIDVDRHQAAPGDLVVLSLRSLPSHVGLVVDHHRFMHALTDIGIVVEKFNSPLWANRLEGIYTHVKR